MWGDVTSTYSQRDGTHQCSPPIARTVVAVTRSATASGVAHRARAGPAIDHAADSAVRSRARIPYHRRNSGVTSPLSDVQPCMNHGVVTAISDWRPTTIHAIAAVYNTWTVAFHARLDRNTNAKGRSAGASAGSRNRVSTLTGRLNQ